MVLNKVRNQEANACKL